MTATRRRAAAEPVIWDALGTTAVLVADGDAPAAREAAEREIAAIDAAASRFDPDSELSRLERADGRWTPISSLLLEALRLAIRAAVLTDGAVDPALGDRLAALGYDRDFDGLEGVEAEAPLVTTTAGGATREPRWTAIELRTDPPAVRVAPGTRLDLGATAKALAADRAARAAARAGGGGVLVGLGGDIATSGPPPEPGWLVRVTDDHRDRTEAGERITITGGGLATSSLVARRWRSGGRAMHHIIDPHSGEPVTPVWRTVSVAAACCADANIASTAALVFGADAPAWLSARSLPARLVACDGTVSVQGGWPP